MSKLLLCPQSGRRHQLRLHCLALGAPPALEPERDPRPHPQPGPQPGPQPDHPTSTRSPTPTLTLSPSAGHPVVGDVAYTGDASSPRMMLHAWMLRLPLPATRARPQQPPICIASFDPFPAAGGAAGRAAWARRGAGAEAAPAVRAVAEVEP